MRHTPASVRRVTLHQIAVELGISEHRAGVLVRKYAWAGAHHHVTRVGSSNRHTYDATLIEKLRALRKQPHRQLQPPQQDWLTDYLQGGA